VVGGLWHGGPADGVAAWQANGQWPSGLVRWWPGGPIWQEPVGQRPSMAAGSHWQDNGLIGWQAAAWWAHGSAAWWGGVLVVLQGGGFWAYEAGALWGSSPVGSGPAVLSVNHGREKSSMS
jgi:hypothetical protein